MTHREDAGISLYGSIPLLIQLMLPVACCPRPVTDEDVLHHLHGKIQPFLQDPTWAHYDHCSSALLYLISQSDSVATRAGLLALDQVLSVDVVDDSRDYLGVVLTWSDHFEEAFRQLPDDVKTSLIRYYDTHPPVDWDLTRKALGPGRSAGPPVKRTP